MRITTRSPATQDKPALSYYARFMGALFNDQKKLGEIQAVYDSLTLMGQLLGAGTDITKMRLDFQSLAGVLLDQLAQEHYKKASLTLTSNARIAVDVLTRNLFERTADIGFLATDRQVCAFAEMLQAGEQEGQDSNKLAELVQHFREYVSKYSVYHNIILLSTQGEILAQLDEANVVVQTDSSLIAEAMNTSAGHIEVFRPTTLLPGYRSPLIYACRVMSADGLRPVGVLCLCFRFEDECQRIFQNLVMEDDWSVVTLLDSNCHVIASSDPYQFPVGSKLKAVDNSECGVIRFGGREYLAATRQASAYQGYSVPGWLGHAMAPLNHAFDVSDAPELGSVSEGFLMDVLEAATLFSNELKSIPKRAALIQQELNRSVWNGNISLARQQGSANTEFAKILLREIGRTGVKTRDVFNESTTNLYKTVVASLMFDCAAQATLAIDIMDRNLYERANDCRWWALTKEFRLELEEINQGRPGQLEQLTLILRRINSLYTVYSNIILFDMHGRVVSVSNPACTALLGSVLTEPWVRETLELKDTQSYVTSQFVETPLYFNKPTYVFAAAVRGLGGVAGVQGGIAVVFDSEPQFKAMLSDVLPRNQGGEIAPDSFAVFVESDGSVISGTCPDFPPGSKIELDRGLSSLDRGESTVNLIQFGERYYAIGASVSAGYREYMGVRSKDKREVFALVFMPLSENVNLNTTGLRGVLQRTPQELKAPRGVASIDIATFFIRNHGYGLPPASILAAVDARNLQPAHSSRAEMMGYLIFNNKPIAVFDLSMLLLSEPSLAVPSQMSQDTDRQQVLVLKTDSSAEEFGILVDDLGEMAEIEFDRLCKMPKMADEQLGIVEGIVKPSGEDPAEGILMLLSVERMQRRLQTSANSSEAVAQV
ncbi:MAG: chemotaxis protein CheW [Limnobacter sp.]|uniref:chemotaxis protein CheW n=1 Tax=Limnobacter sp. TaxID=2003368 RepID=UPI00391D99FD